MQRKLLDPKYGQGVVELGENEVPPSVAELVLSITETFASPSYRPPVLPRAATELLAVAGKTDTPISKIVELLESDPVLAARVVSRANSAAFAGNMPVRTLRDAVSRLGMIRLRDIVVEAAMHLRVFRAPAYQPLMEALSTHVSSTAEFARIVCRYATMDAELAFLAGLLHDIGIAGILIALSERPREQRPDPSLLAYALDQAHVQASERMATLWGLPPDIVMVARYHHEVALGPHVHPLCAVVAVAEEEARRRGRGLPDMDGTPPEILTKAYAALGLDQRKLALMRTDLEKLVASGGHNTPGAAPSPGHAPGHGPGHGPADSSRATSASRPTPRR
jgi:HD-like signal output (HDOD) protein